MWEQCVLNEMHGQLQTRAINYWRDKHGHEIDFVFYNRSKNSISAIECKLTSSPEDLTTSSIGKNFTAFRSYYPDGDNFVVSSNIATPYKRQYDGLTISFVSPDDLIKSLKS